MIGPVLVVMLLGPVPPAPGPASPLTGAWQNRDQYLDLGQFPSGSGAFLSSKFRLRPNDGGTWVMSNVVNSGDLSPGQQGWQALNVGFFGPHLESWCWQGAWANDAGYSAWSPEQCFRYDNLPPTPPGLDAGGIVIDGGWVTASFTPATDPASGVNGYWIAWRILPNTTDYQDTAFFGAKPSSPVQVALGPGNYEVQVVAQDNGINTSASAWVPITISLTSSVLTPPAAPIWSGPYTTGQANGIIWSGSSSRTAFRWRYHYADAGISDWAPWFTHTQATGNFGFWCGQPIPIEVQAAAIDALGNISPWSASSQLGGWDNDDPAPPPSFTVTADTVISAPQVRWQLTYALSSDYWTGVNSYAVESSFNGGPFTSWATNLNGGSVTTSSVTPPGQYQYRIHAIDNAGRVSPWVNSAVIQISPFDAGVDAGPADAGIDAGVDAGVDAGTPDAGVDAGPPDAGPPDAGVPDASVIDAGNDAGAPDANVPDAAVIDAGGTDAGSVDAGTMMQGALQVGCGCQSASGVWWALPLVWLVRRRRALQS